MLWLNNYTKNYQRAKALTWCGECAYTCTLVWVDCHTVDNLTLIFGSLQTLWASEHCSLDHWNWKHSEEHRIESMNQLLIHRAALTLYLLATAAVACVRAEGEPERDKRVCEIDSEKEPVQSTPLRLRFCFRVALFPEPESDWESVWKSDECSTSLCTCICISMCIHVCVCAEKLPKLNAPVFVTYEMRPSDASAGNLQDGTHMYRGTTADSEGWFVNELGQFRHVVIDPVDDEAVLLQIRNPFNNGTLVSALYASYSVPFQFLLSLLLCGFEHVMMCLTTSIIKIRVFLNNYTNFLIN